ncbi:glycosyltransferase [Roseomonas sp. SSH11]|uniref:Glycosyltransferase n=1 Tax=Pararoseomonas baculiformis TaxID=2820812 RepID=A0ABS4ADP4_9PROT|nr:glycosyltransferase [Pararoseomonas baculiformis]MBP0445130.1 glycosyltransferase [Pararoseomonas baculiformis]
MKPQSPQPRVLHIYRRFHPDYTGDGIYYTRLIPAMARHGISGEILVFETRPDHRDETAIHEGVRIHYLANRYPDPSWLDLLRWLAANLHRYDVVHLHSHVDRHFLAYILARVMGRPVLYSCTLNDSPTELLSDYRPSYRRLAALLMRSISTFVVISPQLLRQSLRSVAERRLSFIPQGVALGATPVTAEQRAAARSSLGLSPEDFILLNVGSVSRRKNVRFLVDVLAQIEDPRVKLVVVGPLLEPDYAEEIEQAASQLGGRVILAGFQEDPQLYYTAADAFAFASTAEGFPNVFLEAMSRNLPIITRFLPGLTDFVIDHGRSGFLAHSTADFVAAVQALRSGPDAARHMGLEGRRFADRNLGLEKVAQSYAALYRRSGTGSEPDAQPFPDFRLRFSNTVRGPSSFDLREFDTAPGRPPELQVVIDTEADFDWNKGTVTDTGRVSSIAGLRDSFPMFKAHGLFPALVVDYPVATQAHSARIVQDLAEQGCEVGVHLHSWSTPPQVEPRDDWHSFSGNLGPMLEREKLALLTRHVEALLGHAPRMFKAGRYGLGPHTVAALKSLGFETDLSICPSYNYSAMGGPNFTGFTSRPGWYGEAGGLLSLPTTAARLGFMSRVSPQLTNRVLTGRRSERFAARLNVLYPVRLSPEGNDLETMIALTRRLYASGLRIFTLSLHSPTLQVGNTPYARTQDEVQALLGRIDAYLHFFRAELGGRFSTPSQLRSSLMPAQHQNGARKQSSVENLHGIN